MPIPLLALAPLIPILADLIPDIGRLIAGDAGERVGQVIERAAGSLDPVAVQAAVEDPAKAASIMAGIEEVRAKVEIARIEAAVKNLTSARDTSVALAQMRHPTAYLAPATCVVIFALFAFVVIAETFGYAKDISEATRRLLDYLAIAAAGYAIGSSAGSATKDMFNRAALAANASTRDAPDTPPAQDRGSMFRRS